MPCEARAHDLWHATPPHIKASSQNLFFRVFEVGEEGEGALIHYVDAEADKEATVCQRLAPVCRVLQGKHHRGFLYDALDLRDHAQATLNPQKCNQQSPGQPCAGSMSSEALTALLVHSKGCTGAGSI